MAKASSKQRPRSTGAADDRSRDATFLLRPPRLDDVPVYISYLADPEVHVWLDDASQRPLPPAKVESLLLRDGWCLWAIECEGVMIGVTSLYEPDIQNGTARFSIVIGNRRFWGRGLGTAVAREVVRRAFTDLGLRKVVSDYLEPNAGAAIVHERAGFEIEGYLRQDAWRQGQWVSRVVLSIFADADAAPGPRIG